MKLIERSDDVITGNSNMEDLHTIGSFPVFMGCVDHPAKEDINVDQTWHINKDTGVLQLKKLIPLDILYQAQHAGAVGKIWIEHHTEFAKFLNKFPPDSVLELGGAHGILSMKYGFIKEIPWTILEPNPTPIADCKAKFIKGFFDEKFSYSGEISTVVHSHVFEHIYQPNDFMCQLSNFIPVGKRLIFSVPNMQAMLERNYTNCINFEHTIFLSENYINYLIAKYGFKLLAKEYFKEDHSIFYAVERNENVKPIELPSNLYINNKKLFQDYIAHHKLLIDSINKRTRDISSPIYLFGAHIFSQFLIKMGLETTKIICLLDNDEKKQGKRLYGTDFRVESPEILADVKDPFIILKAGVYNSEIKEQILTKINKNTVFLE
jgi:hypothetical protein